MFKFVTTAPNASPDTCADKAFRAWLWSGM